VITLRNNQLVFRFPEVHADAEFSMAFQRTLRLPDDNREYPLPPSFGRFPLSHVDDHAERLPASWVEHGGVFLPMSQAEAMWIRFSSEYPFAVKIAAGKINAVSGDTWNESLQPRSYGKDADVEQDYITVPTQPWLDGFNIGNGVVRQFVAMPMGAGYSVEAQLTGEEATGGLQVLVMPLKAELYRAQSEVCFSKSRGKWPDSGVVMSSSAPDMALGAGGLMRQRIYRDYYGVSAWDTEHYARCFVHLLNSAQYVAVTGKEPPEKVISAGDYAAAGLPWYDVYDENMPALRASQSLKGIDSIAALGVKKGEQPLPDNKAVIVPPEHVVKVRPVREGSF
jgi:hypothetical protein